MTDVLRTGRQHRERQFYEEYSRRTEPSEISFEPILGNERRPWNPYWFVCEVVTRRFTSPEQRLLDFGCGPGIYSLLFARVGYEVFGFDISPNNIAVASRLAEKYGLEARTQFIVGVAEECAYRSDYFDLVVGIDILHHVDILGAVRECLRVLRPGGVAIFKEPIEVPVLDRLRNTRLGTWLVPKTPSYDRHVTEDERKLVTDDLKAIAALCNGVSIRRFRLFSVLNRFVRRRGDTGPSMLEMVDGRVFSLCRSLQRFGGEIGLTITK